MAKNILIVDDEPHIRTAIKLALTGKGYNLEQAGNADEAMKKIDKDTNLILLDIMMPGTRPVDMLKTLKQHGLTKVKCIYVSAVPFDENRKREMMNEGLIVDYIKKPFTNEELIEKVKKALGE